MDLLSMDVSLAMRKSDGCDFHILHQYQSKVSTVSKGFYAKPHGFHLTLDSAVDPTIKPAS
jgi:hypothetical protein